MAQHDYNIANQSGADFRADLNNALQAIATVNSGASEPSTTFAHQLWVDTSSNVLKIRNAADNAWITTGVSITTSNTLTGNLTGNVTGNLTGNVTGNVTGDLTGNADTATTLATARTISLSGDVVGSASFDGSGDITISTTAQINSIALGTDTTGDYVQSLSGGTGVTVTGGTGEGSTPSISIGQAVSTSDNVTFNIVTATDEFIGDIDGAVRFTAKADVALSKGDVVYVSGVSGNTTTVSKAKADDASKMPAFGLAIEDANANNNLQIVTFGNLTSIDTSNESVGQILYVSTTAGEYTTTAPSGESSQIQNIGKILRSHAVNGSIKVGGAGRSNATPNLDNGKIFIGNGSNQSSTSTLDTSIVVENTNLYYTQARFDSAFSAKSTSDLSEGTNLYYTDARANSAIDARVTKAFVDALGIQASSVAANSVALGTDTTGNYVATITGTANKVSVSGSGSESAAITLSLPDDVQIGDSLTVAGDLTVNGTLTSLDTTNLDIEDNLFQLNAGLTGSPVNDSGMLINRGNQNNGIFMWDESVDKFTLGLTTADGTSTGNITLSSLGTLVANLEGNVTGTIQTASQPNITSVGTLTGLTTTGDINFGDNDKAIFGAGSDLQIYHDSNNSYIVDSGDGNLYINANELRFGNADNSKDYIHGNNGAEVKLYYNNAQKIATTSTGIDVTGTATMDGLTVSGSSTGTLNVVNFLNTNTSANLTSNRLGLGISNSAGTNYTYIEAKEIGVDAYAEMNFYTGSTTRKRLTLGTGGNISFYEDTGTTAKLFWDASAESLGIGTTSPESTLEVKGASATSNNGATVLVTDSASLAADIGGTIALRGTDGSDERTYGLIKAGKLNSTSSAFDGYLSLQTRTNGQANTTEAIRIDSSQNVGIGVIPSAKLHVNGDVKSNKFAFYNEGSGANFNYTGYVRFADGSTERMRIDSSGNLLVGKTATGIATVGAELKSTGELVATVSGDACVFLNRKSSDGDIAQFRKDGTTVGSIGANGGHLYIAGQDGMGLRLLGTNVVPADSSGNSSNGTKDLGGSLAKFKDLYLSGTANVGSITSSGDITLPSSGQINAATALYLDSNTTHFRLNNETELMRIQSSGVGIGTTNPTQMLTLSNGTFQINGSSSFSSNVEIGRVGGDNNMGFATGGTERMRIDTSGNVGIGNNNPSYKLSLKDTTQAGTTIQLFRTGSAAGSMFINGGLAFGADGGNGDTQRMVISSSTGNVGINTDNPQGKLVISNSGAGGFEFTPDTTAFSVANSNYIASYDRSASAYRDIVFDLGGAESQSVRFKAGGSVGIGTSSPEKALHIRSTSNQLRLQDSTNDKKYDLNVDGSNFSIDDMSVGSSRFTIKDGGNVGIGETSPLGKLHVKSADSGASADGSADELVIEGSGDSGLSILSGASNNGTILFSDSGDAAAGRIRYEHNNNALNFGTNGSWDKFYIDSSGNVGISNTSPNAQLHIGDANAEGDATNPAIQIGGTTTYRMGLYTSAEGAVIENKNGDDGIQFRVKTAGEAMRVDGGTGNVGIGTTSPSNALDITRPSGTKTAIRLLQTGYESWEFGMPAGNTAFTFANSGSEKMRIDSSGNLLVGKTSTGAAGDGHQFYQDGQTFHTLHTSSDLNTLHVYDDVDSAYRFYVRGTGSAAGTIHATVTSITGISDKRLKENIKDLDTGLSEVMSLKPRRFDWKKGEGNGSKNVAGFIAQEVETVLPDLIGDYKHEELKDAKSVRMGDMLPTLVKAIQEQQEQIQELKEEIQKLKG